MCYQRKVTFFTRLRRIWIGAGTKINTEAVQSFVFSRVPEACYFHYGQDNKNKLSRDLKANSVQFTSKYRFFFTQLTFALEGLFGPLAVQGKFTQNSLY